MTRIAVYTEWVLCPNSAVVKITKKWNKKMSFCGSRLDAMAQLLGHRVVLGFHIPAGRSPSSGRAPPPMRSWSAPLSDDLSQTDGTPQHSLTGRANLGSDGSKLTNHRLSSYGMKQSLTDYVSTVSGRDGGEWNSFQAALRVAGRGAHGDLVENRVGEAKFFTSKALSELCTRAELLAVRLAPEYAQSWLDFACAICLEVLKNPIVLSCTHRFCTCCITTVVAVSSSDGEASDARGPTDPPTDPLVHGMRFDCPVCRKTQVFDAGRTWVDTRLSEFVEAHFHDDADAESSSAPERQGSSSKHRRSRSCEASCSGLSVVGASPANSSLSSPTPEAAPATAPARTPKVLVAVIEGCRPDALLMADTPWLTSLMDGQEAAFAFRCNGGGRWPQHPRAAEGQRGEATTEEGANLRQWAELLSGMEAPPLSPSASSEEVDSSAIGAMGLTVFERLTAVRPELRSLLAVPHQSTAKLAKKAALNVRAQRGGTGEASTSSSPFEAIVASYDASDGGNVLAAKDARTAEATEDALLEGSEAVPDLVVLQLAQAWGAGAAHGFRLQSQEYRDSLREIDRHLGRIHNAMEARRTIAPSEDWLLLVTGTTVCQPAQGGTINDTNGQGKEGGPLGEPDCFWLISGRAVEPTEMEQVPSLTDVVPTILEHFGITPEAEWGLLGHSLHAMECSSLPK
eukprot:gene12817-15147_t